MNKEREFLHDISGSLAIAHGHVQISLKKLQENSETFQPPQVMERLQKILVALERITELIQKRRQTIMKEPS